MPLLVQDETNAIVALEIVRSCDFDLPRLSHERENRALCSAFFLDIVLLFFVPEKVRVCFLLTAPALCRSSERVDVDSARTRLWPARNRNLEVMSVISKSKAKLSIQIYWEIAKDTTIRRKSREHADRRGGSRGMSGWMPGDRDKVPGDFRGSAGTLEDFDNVR